MKKAMLLMATLVLVAGCNSFERTAFQTLSTTKTALDGAQAAYEAGCPAPAGSTAGCIPHSAEAFAAINKAKAADSLAVQAMVNYEEIKVVKGTTASDLDAAEAAVVADLAELPALIADINTLRGK